MGCRGNEDMQTCENRLNPPRVTTGGGGSSGSSGGGSVTGGGSNGFYIPLTQGKVTQNYYGNNHNAIDISNYEGAPVYAITAGRVITISRNQSCGKNIVYILHNVNGRDYTTVYYHLKTVTVSSGQTVNYTTQIGTQGEDVAWCVLVHRGISRGTNQGQRIRRISDNHYHQTNQYRIQQLNV